MAEQPFNFGNTPASPLEVAAVQYRNTELTINRYGENNPYGLTNPDAISPKVKVKIFMVKLEQQKTFKQEYK